MCCVGHSQNRKSYTNDYIWVTASFTCNLKPLICRQKYPFDKRMIMVSWFRSYADEWGFSTAAPSDGCGWYERRWQLARRSLQLESIYVREHMLERMETLRYFQQNMIYFSLNSSQNTNTLNELRNIIYPPLVLTRTWEHSTVFPHVCSHHKNGNFWNAHGVPFSKLVH